MHQETLNKRSKTKGGKWIPALCNIIGTLILVFVIVTAVPLSVPRFFGYEIYSVVSPSMQPELPVGSVVYVKAAEPKDLAEGDIIAFSRGDTTVLHRIVENRSFERDFITKGDANSINDPDPVLYEAVIGKVEHHFAVFGRFLSLYSSGVGKIYALILALCGVMFNMLASLLRSRRAAKMQNDAEQEL